uniref:Uncharacterized protein n=1 Tax=Anguilla anguilla TaxID=7936 RepID=A0A0E9XX82_ANGAN
MRVKNTDRRPAVFLWCIHVLTNRCRW